MQTETERLIIHALTAEELELLINDTSLFNEKCGVIYLAEPVQGQFKKIVSKQLDVMKQDPENYYWHTFWIIIRKSDSVVVGSIDYKNTPNENGECEIGYGLGKQFEHNGYMTETVAQFCRLAKQNGAKTVIAETEMASTASQNILKRCGFTIYKEAETLWWKM